MNCCQDLPDEITKLQDKLISIVEGNNIEHDETIVHRDMRNVVEMAYRLGVLNATTPPIP